MNKLLVIIPAFNEEKNIVPLLQKLCTNSIRSFADILLINDASSDKTEEIAKKYDISVVSHIFNLGYGASLQVGYKYGVRKGYEYIIQMDGDGQHDVENIPHIYECLLEKGMDGECPDIVIGSRFIKGSKSFKISWIKRTSIAFFSYLIKKITAKVITDPTSGLQGLSRRTFTYYSNFGNFDYSYPDANMLIQMILLDYKIVETTSIMHERTIGVSMHHGVFNQLMYMLIMPLNIVSIVQRLKKIKRFT